MEATARKRQQRHLIACLACRRLRTRCAGNESQRDPCHRCRRLNIACVYARKRTRGSVAGTRLEPPSHSQRLERHGNAPPARVTHHRGSVPSTSFHDPGSAESHQSRSSIPGHGLSPRTGRIEPRRHVIVDYLDPDITRPPSETGSLNSSAAGFYTEDDPIAMELVTASEADHLVEKFMRNLNPILALLDPELHTLEFMRETSSALLSAVLMRAAQFFQPRLYPSLLAHTRELVNRAFSTGVNSNLGMVQALTLLVAWKEPTDSTAGVKLAVAIRLGYQLGLHVPRTTPLPDNIRDARVIADGERTWFTLSCFDRIYADVFGVPPTMRLEECLDCVRWAEETDRFHGGDMRHACSLNSASTYTMLIRLCRTHTTMPHDVAWALLSDIYTQTELHLKHWFPDDPTHGKFSPLEQSILKWFDINNLQRIKFLMLDVCPAQQRDLIVIDWLQLSDQYAAQTEILSDLGCMTYMQDTAATHLSAFGVVGHKMCAHLPLPQRELVVRCIARLSACCDRASTPACEGPMDLVGRFLRRLLRLLSAEKQSHAQADNTRNAQPDPVGAFDLDEFLRYALQPQATNTFESASMDDQMWSMLFPDLDMADHGS